jgi:O-antigen/teichoic acid export membrane protein
MPQGIITQQSIKNTILLYVGVALGFVSTILLYPRILSPAQYGLTRLLLSLALICSHLAHLGLNNLIIRYFPYFRDSDQSKSRFLTLALLISLGGFLLFTILFLLLQQQFLNAFHDRSFLFSSYALLLIPLVLGVLFFEIFNSYVRALHDAVTGTIVHEVALRGLIIGLLFVYDFHLISFTAFMYGFVACYLLQPTLLLIALFRRGELRLAFPRLNKKAAFLKEMAAYGGYSFLSRLAMLLIGRIDIIMIGAILDLSNAAVYAIAFYVSSVIVVPQRSIIKIASPILAGLLKERKYPEISSLYKRTSIDQLVAGSLLYIGIWANMHNLMDLLPAQYHGTKWIILITGFGKLFNMATGVNGVIILNSRYFRFAFFANLFLVVITVAGNYLLIPIYGILGAAIAMAASMVLYNIIKLVFVRMKFSMQPFSWHTPAVVVIAAVCLILSFQIPYLYNFFVDVIVRSLSIAVVFLGLVLLFHLSDDLENLAWDTVARVKNIF